MSNWILTLGLQNLRNQINAAFPNRSTTSDGTIGDAAHQQEVSGHNPDDTPGSKPEWDGDPDNTPEVRAWDMTSDLGPGINCQDVVDHIRNLPNVSSVIRYIIYNRKIYHERNGFAPQPYTGASPHTEHVHFSGAWTQSADNNTSFDFRLDELTMPTIDEIRSVVWEPFQDSNNGPLSETPVGHAVGVQQWPDFTQAGAPLVPYYVAFGNMVKMLNDMKLAIANIENKLGI